MVIALISCGYCSAVDWQSIDTDSANLNLYIDRDSVKNIKPGEYLYAIKYRIGYKPEQVAYIKSNFNNNSIGVIKAGMFEESEYRPQAVFANPRVFMKPVSQESFLNYAHKWVFYAVPNTEDKPSQTPATDMSNSNENKNFVTEKTLEEVVSVSKTSKNISSMKEFVAISGKKIKANWCPPKSGRNTNAILIVEIGADGSLQNYRFAKSSGDKLTDRSIVTAVELAVPFKEISNILKSNVQSMDLQFVFDYKYFRKSVI